MAALLNTVVRSVATIARSFDNVLFPQHCLLSGLPLAPEDEVLPGISRQALDACAPAPDPVELLLLVQRHIAADDLYISSFNAAWAVTDDAPIRHAIHAVKYGNRKRLAYGLGRWVGELVDESVSELVSELVDESVVESGYAKDLLEDSLKDSLKDSLADSLKDSLADLHAVTFIPIHPARRRERGYNQAELIARGVADALELPLLDVMRRTRYTGTQTALSEQQRLVNLHNAFSVHTPDLIRNARILLVDDVLTTGATLNTAAEALIAAGARRVDALTVAATV